MSPSIGPDWRRSLLQPSPRLRARQAAVIALDSLLVIGTGAAASAWMGGSASATVSSPGWSAIQSPYPAGPNAPGSDPRAEIDAADCTSAAFCAAIGGYEDSSHDDYAYLDVLSGGSWTVQEAPVPSDARSTNPDLELDGISCPATGSCTAVGGYELSAGGSGGVIETLSGGHWSATEVTPPSDASTTSLDTYLKSVDCMSVGSCTAVGSYKDSGGYLVPFADTLAGGQWSSQLIPVSTSGTFEGAIGYKVSCQDSMSCVATGLTINSGSEVPFTAQLNGGVWTSEPAPLPSDAATSGTVGILLAPSCTPSMCIAVGFYKDTSGYNSGVADQYMNGSWTTTKTPVPANAGTGSSSGAELLDVSCQAGDTCTAVGAYSDTSGRTSSLAETLSNGVWSAQQAPLPANAATGVDQGSDLSQVSCIAPGECTSVGTYTVGPGDNGDSPFADTESNGIWSAVQAPLPNNAATGTNQSVDLETLVCTSRGGCLAGGDFTDASNAEQGLLESFTPTPGYWEVAGDGGLFSFGAAQFYGSMGGKPLNEPIVGMAPIPGDGGYWEVASDGGMFSFGGAKFYGSMGGKPLNKPIVGMAATPTGNGYWLVASDGGIFAFGDAAFYGSMGGQPLNEPIVGIAATPDGKGYWEVASDGGIFAFGDAAFYGSMGGKPLNEPIVGIAANVTGQGYWEVASDGGMFSFGDTQFYGSMGGKPLNEPIVGLMTTFDGGGYWELASDGGIFSFGDASFQGSMGGTLLNSPVVNGAAT